MFVSFLDWEFFDKFQINKQGFKNECIYARKHRSWLWGIKS